MLNWLIKRSENSRVYMCVKEVKWEVDAADPVRRATILAMSALFRKMFVNEIGFPIDLFDAAPSYPRADLLKFYNALEDVRNQSNRQLEITIKALRRHSIDMPSFSVNHVKMTNRAIELFMCTVGAGIVPDRRDDVRLIWNRLYDANPYLHPAIEDLRIVESRTTELTGLPSEGMFGGIVTSEWINGCDYIPAYLSKTLEGS